MCTHRFFTIEMVEDDFDKLRKPPHMKQVEIKIRGGRVIKISDEQDRLLGLLIGNAPRSVKEELLSILSEDVKGDRDADL